MLMLRLGELVEGGAENGDNLEQDSIESFFGKVRWDDRLSAGENEV